MKLKKGDLIHSIERRSIHSKKQAYKLLKSFLKSQEKFSVFVSRGGKNFLVSYKASEEKNKFNILSIKKIKPEKGRAFKHKKPILAAQADKAAAKPRGGQQSGPAKISSGKEPEKKLTKKLVPDKYKAHLQKAYIISLHSFIYKKPDFDSAKLHALSVGDKILISKKVFRPAHNFGSFYKAFLQSPKKIIGYVSEAETAAEFIKTEKGRFAPSKAYQAAEKQMKRSKTLDIDLIAKLNKEQRLGEENKTEPARARRRAKIRKKTYIGFSAGSYASYDPKSFHIGFKLSGHGLPSSSLNMDFNLTAAPADFRFFHFDILASYPLIKSKPYYLAALGGALFNINLREMDPRRQSVFGGAAGLALMMSLSESLLFRIDAKAEYGFINGYGLIAGAGLAPNISASLQFGF